MVAIVRTEASAPRRVVVPLGGLVLVATGVAPTIRAELGVAPHDTTGALVGGDAAVAGP